jgi:peptidoglycan/xylan/chitin deacetylase (PgdA/CDA1 family)
MHRSLKAWIRVAVSYGLYYTGLLQLWQTIAMRRKAVVLMYHRVLDSDQQHRTGSHPAIVIDHATFDAHLSLLKRRFNVLSPAEFASHLEHGTPFPDRSCLITFDDGWRDNVTNAWPTLQRYDLPALIFLPVNYVGSKRLFWPEALSHLLCLAVIDVRRHPERRAVYASLLADSHLAPVLDLADEDPRPAVVNVVRADRSKGRAAMEALVMRLAEALRIDTERSGWDADDGFMGWEEVAAMASDGIAFGGHGADHHLLTQVPLDTARAEIVESKRVLDAKLPAPVTTFSYPNGYWTPEVKALVRDAGYRLAFVTKRGFVSCTDDPFTVGRLNVHQAMTSSKPMLLARIVGLL